MSDLYLERMLADLEMAEQLLRKEIGTPLEEPTQANVDRLHKLIREYLEGSSKGKDNE